MKTGRNIVIIVAILAFIMFVVLIVQEISRDRPFSWNPSYSSLGEDPYGSKIFHDRLNDLFPNHKVRDVNRKVFKSYEDEIKNWPDYEDQVTEFNLSEIQDGVSWDEENDSIFIDSIPHEDSDVYEEETTENAESYDYFIKQDRIDSIIKYDIPNLEKRDTHSLISLSHEFGLYEYDAKSLLIHVYQGNDALIIANQFSGLISDYFNISTHRLNLTNLSSEDKNAAWTFSFKNEAQNEFFAQPIRKNIEKIGQKSFFPQSYQPAFYFTDTTNAEVLAYNKLGKPILIKYKHGKGSFILCSAPLAFTNYFILKKNRSFLEQIIKTVPNSDVYVANNYSGNSNRPPRPDTEKESYLSFIMSRPALKWAWFLLLFTIITFMLFEIRRKQKIVPIITPPKNTSLQFVDTIAQLYLTTGDHKDIAQKKFNYFLEFLRSRYHVRTAVIDAQFYKTMSEKTPLDVESIERFFVGINLILKRSDFHHDDLIRIYKRINKFKEELKGTK